jgi:histidine triad (HIT) family protein
VGSPASGRYDPGVTATARPGCLFCRIAAGEERAWKLYEDEHALAILDRFPAVPGHTLVIPRRHAADIWDIRREDAGRLMEAVHDVAALLKERLSPDGMTLFQANRAAGWQTVFHIHVHLVPRHRGDPLTASWQPRRATEAELDATLGRIAQGR